MSILDFGFLHGLKTRHIFFRAYATRSFGLGVRFRRAPFIGIFAYLIDIRYIPLVKHPWVGFTRVPHLVKIPRWNTLDEIHYVITSRVKHLGVALAYMPLGVCTY